jgi:hypothetical protein
VRTCAASRRPLFVGGVKGQYTVESDEDQRLLELIESGRSWVLISALLKRSQLSIKDRARHLKRKSVKTKPLE